MLETKQETFLGVRFVLLGFDPITQNKVRSKLVNGGGVDVGQYSQNCTHVIVDKLVYDDSVCVAARRDGKTLVTGLWVDHSFDIGVAVDATSVLYRPLKDLDGIPGAKSLIMCLTGYQRQDRDDIMTMVGLMGAQFSKPLVANKVTHLICYKFEGEKYELAKKMKKIKLINHRWLEDCLTAWELLPEANYNKSGFELEMEAEAKDSEEEPEESVTKQFRGRSMNLSPYSLQTGMPRARELPMPVGEVSKLPLDTTAINGPLNVVNDNDILLAAGKDSRSDPLSLHNVNMKHPEAFGCQNTGALGNSICGELSEPCERTPISTKVANDLASTSRSAKTSPHSEAAKLSALSYSRKNPRRSSLEGEISGKVSSPVAKLGEFKVSNRFDISPSKVEQAKDGIGSGCVKTPLKGTDLLHEEELTGMSPQKRKMDGSCASSKSQKMSHDSKPCISGSPMGINRIHGLEPTDLMNGPHEINNRLSLGNNRHPLDETASLYSVQNTPTNVLRTKSLGINKQSVTRDLSISKTMTSEVGQDGNAEEEAPQASFGKLEQSALSSKPDTLDLRMGISPIEIGERGVPQIQKQDVEVSPPNTKKLDNEKSHSPPNLDFLEGGNNNSLSKPLKKKTVAKRSLGSTVSKKSWASRPKLSASSTTYRKGPIHFKGTASPNDATICSTGGKETANSEKSSNPEKLEVALPTVHVESVMEVQTKMVLTSGNDNENEIESMDDETEAPEDKDEHEFEKAVDEKSDVVELAHKADVLMEEKSEGEQHLANNINADIDHAMASEEGKNGPEIGKATCGKMIEVGESTKTDAMSGKITKGKKRSFGKTKTKTFLDVVENKKSKECVDGEETQSKMSSEKREMEEERVPHSAGKTQCISVVVDKLENFMEVEKENNPIINKDKNISQNQQGDVGKSKQRAGKVAVKSNETVVKTKQKTGKIDADSTQVGGVQKRVKSEPLWFILSGHKLQRKEFQKIIRHLKGRFCRDSHHWSYQATHFIVPDPIRRTEKFFAAVASGRWVLKTDYLTASSQAGKFLAEEPYEWHKNGLSEDGAINLEAPRKWRLLRERTGHGAFYGMRIIIYGECIAPPLDTLKRVVKAGDGTILATSPPYTRFLNSGVDFAIVSPGMPRVDLWVQEFLRHEIPCIVADYLVEYVCKPGYSLERHVQYNTHAWADKTFANLLSRSKEIVEDLTPPDDHVSNDLPCQVCGSRDRGEVMLICGDESGSVGCGVVIHIDCCDPPLEEVPEEDWFCPKCSRSKSSSNSTKNTKKRTSSKSK
ncbi:hypothetical protein L1049_005250 [Liquidambar formosana]|uniref:BRCT domain-containing protein n=1 Tax=Liquidambar formosana TaxID=63359 RepID=A0AAP0RPV7_LIQFO